MIRYWLIILCASAQFVAKSQNYTVTTVAGTTRVTEGVPATSAPLRAPSGVAFDGAGNLYIADSLDNRVRKVDTNGNITTFAGTGAPGYTGDRGKATMATLFGPASVAVDSAGNVYIADGLNNCVRKVTTDGIINTVAGTGASGSGGDGGLATKAQVEPTAVAVDASGNLYIGDAVARIRKVDGTSGIITTIAGTGRIGFSGDGGLATMAQINQVSGITATADGSIYLADSNNFVVRRIDANGIITSVAGSANPIGYVYDGAPAAQYLIVPTSVILNGTSLYVTDINQGKLLRVDLTANKVYTVAGNGNSGFSGDNGPPPSAEFDYPNCVVEDSSHNFYVADQDNLRVRKVTTSLVTTIAGTSVGDGGTATKAYLNYPVGVAVDSAGQVEIADSGNSELRVLRVAGTIGSEGNFNGGSPQAVAADAAGNVYVSDSEPLVLKVTQAGLTSIVAGNVNNGAGYDGDNGPATQATIEEASGIAVDNSGNLYLTDPLHNYIRKVTAATGVITTIAGNGKYVFSGDGGPALKAAFDPQDIAVDGSGNLYIADEFNNRIRKIGSDGMISTVAGNGIAGYAGDGGPATQAHLNGPTGVAVDSGVNLYIADGHNHVVRRVTPSGLILTIAGNGMFFPATGDGGPALAAQMNPFRVALDGTGGIYISDFLNDRIRKLTLVAQTAAKLAIVSGNNQSGTAGTALANALVVKVTDTAGASISGVQVNFVVSTGTATANPAAAVTLADGTASTTVTLGATAGMVQINAQAAGLANATFTLTATTAVSPTAPVISAGGIVGAGLSTPPVTVASPNGLVSIFGSLFAAPGTFKQVSGSDLVNGKIPTNLAGVCVQVGSMMAPVLVVTPQQLNVQVPTLAPGTYPVQVMNGCGTANQQSSNVVSVTIQATSPQWFYLPGSTAIAAINAQSGTLIAQPGSIPGATTVAAKPDDILTLFCTGGGLTNPSFQAGDLPGTAAQVTAAVQVSIGGVTLPAAKVLYAGVTQDAGLYQVNIQLPASVTAGNQPVILTVGGVATPAGTILIATP